MSQPKSDGKEPSQNTPPSQVNNNTNTLQDHLKAIAALLEKQGNGEKK